MRKKHAKAAATTDNPKINTEKLNFQKPPTTTERVRINTRHKYGGICAFSRPEVRSGTSLDRAPPLHSRSVSCSMSMARVRPH